MEQLLGKWTWACLVNRPSLSVFNSVYRFVERSRNRIFAIWPSVENELRTIMDLAPLLFTSLSDPWFHRAIATDASEWGQGVVATDMPSDFHNFSSSKWTTIIASPWTREEHINILEVRSVYTAVRWVLSSLNCIRRRIYILCDSQVTVGCISKGRSSSNSLLPRLRQLASVVLASGVRLYLHWIPSELNPADGPSRRYEPV